MGDMAGDSSVWRPSVATATVKGAVDGDDAAAAGLVAVPFAGAPFGLPVVLPGGVSGSSSGIVWQYVLRTCLRAGRRMGFDKKKSMPESRHSYNALASETPIESGVHTLTLLSSA